jgi:hypothetical protein
MQFTRKIGSAFATALLVCAIGAGSASALPPSEGEGGEGGGSGGTGGGGGVAATYRFIPIRLTVHDIEDGWGDNYDEPRMYYSGQTFATTIINKGTVDGSEMPQATFTGSQMQFDLWERDNGWNDNNKLGTAFITSARLGEEQSVAFRQGGYYDYELVYKVERL